MKLISNKGNAKQVKYSTGMLMDIPKGSVSLPDDPNLNKMVNSSADLSFITAEEFYRQHKITPTKEKIAQAKKEKPPIEPPEKKKKSGGNKKKEDKPVGDKPAEGKTEKPQGD